MDKRTILAFTISLAILVVWSFFFAPHPPPAQNPSVAPSTTADGATAGATGGTGLPGSIPPGPAASGGTGAASDASGAPSATPEASRSGSAVAERREAPPGTPPTVVETPYARIQIDSVGGVVHSWTLAQYQDDKGQP